MIWDPYAMVNINDGLAYSLNPSKGHSTGYATLTSEVLSLLQVTLFVDADHAHNIKTRRSITGFIDYVGSKPVVWFSKHQGSIASSTYSAEFSALCKEIK